MKKTAGEEGAYDLGGTGGPVHGMPGLRSGGHPEARGFRRGEPELDRTSVYIANIVKCRPPRNRDPLNTEQDACIGFLRAQTALIRPKIIVCLGRIAAMRIIDPNFRITRQHGQWFQRAGVHMTALYHPSALLRDPGKRPETFLDLKSIQGKIKELCPETFVDPLLPAKERNP